MYNVPRLRSLVTRRPVVYCLDRRPSNAIVFWILLMLLMGLIHLSNPVVFSLQSLRDCRQKKSVFEGNVHLLRLLWPFVSLFTLRQLRTSFTYNLS